MLHKWSGTGLQTMEFIGFGNFIKLFNDPVFFIALRNNFSFGFYITLGNMFLGLTTALIIAEEGLFSNIYQVIFMMPITISFIVVAVLASMLFSPTYSILNKVLISIGLDFLTCPWLGDIKATRTVIILVSIWKGFGVSMLIFVARIKEISQDIIDAAAVDGADFFQRTWFITLPLLREVTIVILMLEVINVFRMYDVIWTITEGGPNNVSHVLATYAYQNGFYYDKMGYGTAISAIILIIAGFFTFLQLKYLRGEEIT